MTTTHPSSAPLSILYPLTPANRQRPASAPPPILCLGLPRTGTESLCKALSILDYGNPYHGFDLARRPGDPRAWVPLMEAKLRQVQRRRAGLAPDRADEQLLRAFPYDTILGDVSSVTDQPCCVLHDELLSFYPAAPVVLNRRDTDAWLRSMAVSVHHVLHGAPGAVLWLLHFFDAHLYWLYRDLWLYSRIIAQGSSFQRYGRQFAEQHYAAIERRLQREGRPYLDWRVTEGWAPLCAYLGKEVPRGVEFPSGNRTGKEFDENVANLMKPMLRRAGMRFLGVVVVVGAVIVGSVRLVLQ